MSKFTDAITNNLNRFFGSRDEDNQLKSPKQSAVVNHPEKQQPAIIEQKSNAATSNYFPRNVSNKYLLMRSGNPVVKTNADQSKAEIQQQRLAAKRQFDQQQAKERGERRFQQFNHIMPTERRNSSSRRYSDSSVDALPTQQQPIASAQQNKIPEVQQRRSSADMPQPSVVKPTIMNPAIYQYSNVGVQPPRPVSPVNSQPRVVVEPKANLTEQQMMVQKPAYNALQGPKSSSTSVTATAALNGGNKMGPSLALPPKPVDLTKQPSRSALAGSRGLWPALRSNFLPNQPDGTTNPSMQQLAGPKSKSMMGEPIKKGAVTDYQISRLVFNKHQQKRTDFDYAKKIGVIDHLLTIEINSREFSELGPNVQAALEHQKSMDEHGHDNYVQARQLVSDALDKDIGLNSSPKNPFRR